jgi:hypothetical protein
MIDFLEQYKLSHPDADKAEIQSVLGVKLLSIGGKRVTLGGDKNELPKH